MTATTVTDVTIGSAPRDLTSEPHPARAATLLQRWAVARRRRQYLAAKQRHDSRDRTDRYLDGADGRHQRQALVAFIQR